MYDSCKVIIVGLCFWTSYFQVQAQAKTDQLSILQDRLDYANRLIELNQTDTAEVVLSNLIAEAIHHDLIDSPLGLSIRYAHANSCLYIKNHFSFSLLLK